MRDLLLLAVYGGFLVLGAAAPFVLALGYVWVDAFRPQEVSYGLLTSLPVSMMMGAAAVGGWFMLDRREPARPGPIVVLMLLFALWCTLSTAYWAAVPTTAWWKWNWAFKTMVFAAFIPLVIRSRVQIEALLQVYLLAIAAHFLPFAGKTIIAGGGYGHNLGLIQGNSGLAEGATLATAALLLVPIALFLGKHTRVMPRIRLTRLLYLGLAIAAVVAAVGTYQRTALIGMAVLAVFLLLQSRRKWLTALAICIGVSGVALLTTDAWTERISTIRDYRQESSALTRLLVWQWTLRYVQEHPFGGGFGVSEISRIVLPPTPDEEGPQTVIGRAFHSIYFEVLGEQGWLGFALFFGMVGAALLAQQEVIRRARRMPGFEWAGDLAKALRASLAIFLACGAFIGIAFQPMFYFLLAVSASLLHQVRRSAVLMEPQADTTPRRRPVQAPAVAVALPRGTDRRAPQAAYTNGPG